MIAIIVARSQNRVIGRDGDIPWGRQLKGDLERFKKLTMSNTVIMGRKTYESLGHPLQGRTNIVLSRNPGLAVEGCEIATSLTEALSRPELVFEQAFIIGGGSVYAEALAVADTVYETVVEAEFEGETFFPDIDPAIWEVVSEESGCTSDPLPTRYVTHWRRQ